MPRKRKKTHEVFHEYITKYYWFMVNTGVAATASRHQQVLRAYLKHLPGNRHPEDILRGDAEDYKLVRSREIGPRTLITELGVLKSFWAWLVDMELVAVNPWAKVQVEAKKKAPRREPEDIELYVSQLLEACTRGKEKLALLLILTGLLTRQDLYNLTWNDIDFDLGLLALSTGEGTYTIPLRDDVRELLAKRKGEPDAKVFPGSIQTLDAAWRRIRNRAGLPSVPFKCVRQTGARLLYRAGVDIVTLQHLLRQRSVSHTLAYLGQPITDLKLHLEQISL